VIWSNLDTTYTSDGAGIYYGRSEDSGKTFISGNLINASIAIKNGLLLSYGEIVIIACYGIIDSKIGIVIRRSDDGGRTFNQSSQLIHERSYPEAIAVVNGNIVIQFSIIGSASRGILLSQDNGITWDVINNTSPQLTSMIATQDLLHAVGPANRETGTEVGYYYSINKGRNWYGPDIISFDDGIPSLYPKIVATDDGTLYVTWHEAGKIYIRRSGWYDDEGTLMWDTPVLLSEGTSNILSDIAVHKRNIATAWEYKENNQNNVIFRHSGDGGINFCPSEYPSPTNEGSEPSILTTGDTVHLVWNSETPAGSEIFYRQGILREFPTNTTPILHQNYPNPASIQTTIEFELQSPEFVEIILFNTIGQKIMTIAKGMYGLGKIVLPVKIPGLASGVYFYRLTTRNSAVTKKLIILQ
jgi:hypothetical protein